MRRSRLLKRLQDLEDEEIRVISALKESNERRSPTPRDTPEHAQLSSTTMNTSPRVPPREAPPQDIPPATTPRVTPGNTRYPVTARDDTPETIPTDSMARVTLRNTKPRIPLRRITPQEPKNIATPRTPAMNHALAQKAHTEAPETLSRIPVPKKTVRFSLGDGEEELTNTPSNVREEKLSRLQASLEKKCEEQKRVSDMLRRPKRVGGRGHSRAPADTGDMWLRHGKLAEGTEKPAGLKKVGRGRG